MHMFGAPTVPPALQWLLGFARCSVGVSLLLSGCADQTPPRFAGELTLALTGTHIDATWPAATDDLRVEAYLIHLDGAAVARLDRDTLGYIVDGLQERTTRAVRVTAVDAAGNESMPLEATLSIPDRTLPLFPADARMNATGDLRQVTLTWPPATDEGAVHYVVFTGNQEVGTVILPTFTFSRAAVDADFSADTSVQAIDDAGNRSLALVSRWEQFFLSPQWREERRLAERAAEARLAHDGEVNLFLPLFGANDADTAFEDVLAGQAVYGSASDGVGVSELPRPAGDSNGGVGGCISPCGGTLAHRVVSPRE